MPRLTPFLLCVPSLIPGLVTASETKRPMTFRDVIEMRRIISPDVSPDGERLLYVLETPDWKSGQSHTDIYLVPMREGVAATRRLTFTSGRNESLPRWAPNSRLFVFASDRDAPAVNRQDQLYAMNPDGGEARRITDAKDGTGRFEFSPDGHRLAFSAGKTGEQQIWTTSIDGTEISAPKQLTHHSTAIPSWRFSPDGKRIYFTAPDAPSAENKARVEKKFTARLRNEATPLVHLWVFDIESSSERRLTGGEEYSVGDITVSRDGNWIAFRGYSSNRYHRNVAEEAAYADLYLIEASTGQIERLTHNVDSAERGPWFSPDSRWIAFAAPDEFAFHRNSRVYIRAVSARGQAWRKLGGGFDNQVDVDFWSEDARTIFFNTGIGATTQFMALSVDTGQVTPVSTVRGTLAVQQDEDSKALLATLSDPTSPANLFALDSPAAAVSGRWRQLTDANPQVRELALGETTTVHWTSHDGRRIEGVLTKPLGYERRKRYPLVVSIHGGPAGADTLAFASSATNYPHVLAAAGYAVLRPNYRASTNYGEKFKMETAGDYFRLGFDDIMTGVDHLVGTGLADPDRLVAMGWSAGGHYSNWILTHTTRFKAISTGAGAVNWISMYAQSDVQRVREFYFGGSPYHLFDRLLEMSPIKYIRNARTPTLIHCVDGDPRVPRAQSDELHMGLKKLGVPTEYLVYPGSTHGIPDMRNRVLKMMAELQWFEKHLGRRQSWLDWKEVLATVEEPAVTSRSDR
jgi:dipeptidyl aminopeptidase/acylaminoacyl peptidase